MDFEWDPTKAAANVRKHGVTFEQAVGVFSDPLVYIEQDRHFDGEERWIAIGISGTSWLLLNVAHTIRNDDQTREVIRIISAREATPAERRRYESG